MNKQKIAQELLAVARDLTAADTFKCPDCGSKVLEQTGFCVKCKKKVKKAREMTAATIPSIVDMDIHLRQSGTSYMASSKSFRDRYDGAFKASFMGQGSTPHDALVDLMENVYKYYTKKVG